METLFYNSTIKKHISFDELVEAIASYIDESPKSDYRITVGSDSPGVKNTFFVTAITVLRVGNGGRYFWSKTGTVYCHTLQERIYKEVMRSITLTQELKSKLKDTLGEEFFWDNKIAIHIDVGENGQTKDLVDSVVGMVKGYGFEAAIKPEAYCACTVADKHT